MSDTAVEATSPELAPTDANGGHQRGGEAEGSAVGAAGEEATAAKVDTGQATAGDAAPTGAVPQLVPMERAAAESLRALSDMAGAAAPEKVLGAAKPPATRGGGEQNASAAPTSPSPVAAAKQATSPPCLPRLSPPPTFTMSGGAVEALFENALLYESLGDVSRARAIYARIATSKRGESLLSDRLILNAMVRDGLLLMRCGQHKDAMRDFHAALEIDRSNVFCWMALGQLQARMNHVSKAFALYQNCLECNPEISNDPILWVAIGLLYQTYRQLGEVAEAFRAAQRVQPIDYEFRDVIFYHIARLRALQGDYESSLMLYSQALQFRAEERQAYARQMLGAEPCARPVAAGAAASTTATTATYGPGRSAATAAAGAPYSTGGGGADGWSQHTSFADPAAHEAPQRAVPSAPAFNAAREASLRSTTLTHTQYVQYEQQRVLVAKLNGLDLVLDDKLSAISDARTWCEIGHIYLSCSNVNEARKALENALVADPADVEAIQQFSWVLILLEEAVLAVDHMRRCVQLDPTNAHSWYLLGRALIIADRHVDACDAYRQAMLRDPNHANYWCSIGVLYFHMGQFADAADAYLQAIRLNPALCEAWYDLGVLYETHGQLADARDAYQRALSISPDHANYRERYMTIMARLSGASSAAGARGGGGGGGGGDAREAPPMQRPPAATSAGTTVPSGLRNEVRRPRAFADVPLPMESAHTSQEAPTMFQRPMNGQPSPPLEPPQLMLPRGSPTATAPTSYRLPNADVLAPNTPLAATTRDFRESVHEASSMPSNVPRSVASGAAAAAAAAAVSDATGAHGGARPGTQPQALLNRASLTGMLPDRHAEPVRPSSNAAVVRLRPASGGMEMRAARTAGAVAAAPAPAGQSAAPLPPPPAAGSSASSARSSRTNDLANDSTDSEETVDEPQLP